jgi:ferrous iron transport protein A
MISNLQAGENLFVKNANVINTATRPLNELSIGDRARVIEIQGGKQMTRRLMGLGLKAGSNVTVLHRRGQGVVVGSGGNRIAIGGGVADRVRMQLLTQSSPDEDDG